MIKRTRTTQLDIQGRLQRDLAIAEKENANLRREIGKTDEENQSLCRRCRVAEEGYGYLLEMVGKDGFRGTINP